MPACVDGRGEQSPRQQPPSHVPEPWQAGKALPSTISFAMDARWHLKGENTCFRWSRPGGRDIGTTGTWRPWGPTSEFQLQMR